MTNLNGTDALPGPAVLPASLQEAVWFLGALVRVRLDAQSTSGQLAVLEHLGERGYGSPVHRHDADEETFLVLEGELRVEVGGQARAAGAGAAAFLPRGLPHAFGVTSPPARFLPLHTPAGFDQFTLAAGDAGHLPRWAAARRGAPRSRGAGGDGPFLRHRDPGPAAWPLTDAMAWLAPRA